jgi:hypothetical protein
VTRDTGLPKNVHHRFRAEQQFDRPRDERCHRLLVAQEIFAYRAHWGVGSRVPDDPTARLPRASKHKVNGSGISPTNGAHPIARGEVATEIFAINSIFCPVTALP